MKSEDTKRVAPEVKVKEHSGLGALKPRAMQLFLKMRGKPLTTSTATGSHTYTLNKDNEPHPSGSPEAAAHDAVEHHHEQPAMTNPEDKKAFMDHMRTRYAAIKAGKGKQWERDSANQDAGMQKSGLGDAIAASAGRATGQIVGDPTGGGSMGAGGQGVPSDPVTKADPSVASRYINPKLLSTEPTHMKNGVRVKHLNTIQTDKGPSHVVEIMEGEHKGKWTQAHDHELKPLKKAGGLMGAANPFYQGPKTPEAAPQATPKPAATTGTDMASSINRAGAKTQAAGGNAEANKNRLGKAVDAKEEHYKLSERLGRAPTDDELRDHIADLHDSGHADAESHMESLRARHAALKGKMAKTQQTERNGSQPLEKDYEEGEAHRRSVGGNKTPAQKQRLQDEKEAHEADRQREQQPLSKAAPNGVDEAKYKRCKEDVKRKQGDSVNEYAICAAALKKSVEIMRNGSNPMKKAEGAPAAPATPAQPARPTSTLMPKKPKKPKFPNYSTGSISVVGGAAGAPAVGGGMGKADGYENPLQRLRKCCGAMKKAQGAPPSF